MVKRVFFPIIYPQREEKVVLEKRGKQAIKERKYNNDGNKSLSDVEIAVITGFSRSQGEERSCRP